MGMQITPKTFFEHYIIDPFSYELNSEERIIALFLSIIVFALTLGMAHIGAIVITEWNFRRCRANLIPELQDNFQKVITKTNQEAIKILNPSALHGKTIDTAEIPNFVQQMINERYSQPLPKKSEVTVPFRDGESWDKTKWVPWESLSQKEKLEVNNHFAHPHGQIWDNIFGEAIIDVAFFGWGQDPYIPKDPREYHGSDHCVRTAIFASVFAYLYHKYHPGYEVTLQQAALAAVVGAGHDVSRQTEVADVYDEKSAEITCEFLKKWGITDEDVLKIAKQAIADKDNSKLDSKSLIGKCVQNADSAEFARLTGFMPAFPRQSDDDFEKSRGYLDIYKELKELVDSGKELKNGLSFENFIFELDSVRKEMNALIYQTHKKSTRTKLSESDNYFNGIVHKINRVQYPLLSNILTKVGIVTQIESKASPEEVNISYTPLPKMENTDEQCFSRLELLEKQLNAIVKAPFPKEQNLIRNQAETLHKESLELLKQYKEESSSGSQDPRILMTVSLALEKACHLYLKSGDLEKAKETLKDAVNIPCDDSFDPESLLKQLKDNEPIFILRGSEYIRKRRIRLSKKTIDGKKVTEISFELTRAARKKLNKKLPLIKGDPDVGIFKGDSLFAKQDLEDEMYFSKNDKRISFDGVNVFVGKDKSLYNQYHHVRVIVDEGTSKEKIQRALARMGLSMALLPSRIEDEHKEALGRAVAFRYPQAIYKEDGKQLDPQIAYQQLDENQKQQIDQDINNIQVRKKGTYLTELVNPKLPEEFWKHGVRSIGTFCRFSKGMKETAKVIGKILSSGSLSSQERFQRDIFSTSFCSTWNNCQGSLNQVFTRVFPKSWFEKKLSLDEFSLKGPVLILFNVRVFEKMPYSYPKDRGGVRNPNFSLPVYAVLSRNQAPELFFQGSKKMAHRRGFPENIHHIEETEAVQNEFMFDTLLGPEYIDKLVVQNEVDKYELINQLEKQGIFEFKGKSMRDVIIVSDHLDPSMIDGFEQE